MSKCGDWEFQRGDKALAAQPGCYCYFSFALNQWT